MPAGPMAPGGAGAGRGAGSGAPVGQQPAGKQTSTRPAAATRASAPTGPAKHPEPDRTPSPDVVTMAPIPVSAARAERDAIAEAAAMDAARRGGPDPLRLARRIAGALNAPGVGGEGDFGFFWVTAVTTDGAIVVANSYGLAYIPDGVQLPQQVHMASADEAIPATERARWATYPVIAVQGWAAHHNTKLRAVIATAEQLANSDPGAAKIVLEPDDIPDSGEMVGRSRLEVVDPGAGEQLAATTDVCLIDLLPPAAADAEPSDDQRPTSEEVMDPEVAARVAASLEAGTLNLDELLAQMPAVANAPADQRPSLWFEVMKPMTSSATGREAAHLRAFHTYAAAAQEAAVKEAHTAVDPVDQRAAVSDWLYWKHVTGLLGAALASAS
jgi:hypothetical protein